MVLNAISNIARVVSEITGVIAFIALIIKPIRERVLGATEIREGQKSLLRDRMSATYYKHVSDKSLHQYEYETS